MLIGRRRKFIQNVTRDFLLRGLATHNDTVHYVHVGANDGQLDDPVFRIAQENRWAALLIEPNPTYFDRLRALYDGQSSVTLVNCGVSDTEGELDLFYLDPQAEPRYPAWAQGCASLSRERLEETLLRHPGSSPSDVAVARIPLRRLDRLLTEHDIRQTDLLVVDVEGHELNVLRSVDLAGLAPKLLMVEVNGPDISKEEDILAIMRDAGYSVHRIGDDLIGLDPEFPPIDASSMLELIGFPRN